jgi:hypothetical protein
MVRPFFGGTRVANGAGRGPFQRQAEIAFTWKGAGIWRVGAALEAPSTEPIYQM